MGQRNIRGQLGITLCHLDCDDVRRFRSRHVRHLALSFPEKLHLIPQTPFIDELMPEMKRRAAEYLLVHARKAGKAEVTIDAKALATRISDADAFYYAAVVAVAPDSNREDHHDWNPRFTRFMRGLKRHDGLSTYDAIRRHKEHDRLVSEQKKQIDYRGLSEFEHKEVALRRKRFGFLLGLVSRHLGAPATTLNQKFEDLVILVLAEVRTDRRYVYYHNSTLHADALARQPRIAQLVSEIAKWLRDED